MILVTHELIATLQQKIRTPNRPVFLEAIRPHLLKYASPAGSLKLRLLDSGGRFIAESNSINISALSSATYFHGVVKFDLKIPLVADTVYIVEIVPSGYTFNPTSFIGWVAGTDLKVYDSNYSPDSGIEAAQIIEFWERRPSQRGF